MADSGSITLFIGPMFAGKCLEQNTLVKIYNSDTCKTARDIVVGDLLVDDCGNATRVESLYSATGDLYRVVCGTASYIVNYAHVIALTLNNERYLNIPIAVLLETPCILKTWCGYSIEFVDNKPCKTLAPISIQKVEAGAYYGFELTGSGLFLLANGIVTHNTSHLCSSIEKYRIAGKKCVILQNAADTRYEVDIKNGGIFSHAGSEYSQVEIIKTKNIHSVFHQLQQYDVIGIDELQMYSDAPEYVQLLANAGKKIIASGIDSDFLCRSVDVVRDIIPLAESIKKLTAICNKCNAFASFTHRISNETEIQVIGGKDKYIPLCRKCMFSN